jgi:hypothetical protein
MKINSIDGSSEMRTLIDNLVAKSTQHVVQKYALQIVLSSCINFLDRDEKHYQMLKKQYFQLFPHFAAALIST